MVWELILWIIFFIINVALLASNLYQVLIPLSGGPILCNLKQNVTIVCLSDLESDYMNPYESSSRINAVVVPEMVLHGVCSFLLLVMGYWFMFLLTLPMTMYNSMLYIKRKHLIDVTEVFRHVDAEKKIRIAKLVVYLFLFVLVVIRSVVGGKFSNILEPFHPANEDLDILSHVLEF